MGDAGFISFLGIEIIDAQESTQQRHYGNEPTSLQWLSVIKRLTEMHRRDFRVIVKLFATITALPEFGAAGFLPAFRIHIYGFKEGRHSWHGVTTTSTAGIVRFIVEAK